MGGAIFQGAFKMDSNSIPNVTGITFDDQAADVISRVVGDTVDTHYAGTANVTGSVNCELAAASATVVGTNFPRGKTGAVEIHLFGDTATYLEITSTDGVILGINSGGTVNGITAFTINFALNDVTYAAAS